jgi:sarcosine oxidase subunit delta
VVEMMQIPCPWCGPRDEAEFVCGGQTHIARPPLESSDADWGRYLFERDNPKGLHFERWLHRMGCQQWFNVARDTVTHEIKAVYRMTDRKPEIAE